MAGVGKTVVNLAGVGVIQGDPRHPQGDLSSLFGSRRPIEVNCRMDLAGGVVLAHSGNENGGVSSRGPSRLR
jgi:hypothetical protein